ncbi:hypothetical protein HDU91_001120 [Kappamyces sp. JEL0680]|nr:hypothetical protein HDU91_001120 [Kappamyces sp. JEL0680]
MISIRVEFDRVSIDPCCQRQAFEIVIKQKLRFAGIEMKFNSDYDIISTICPSKENLFLFNASHNIIGINGANELLFEESFQPEADLIMRISFMISQLCFELSRRNIKGNGIFKRLALSIAVIDEE